MSHCFVLGATKFEAPNLIWMVKIVVILGNQKSLIDADRIEIDEGQFLVTKNMEPEVTEIFLQ